MDCVVEVVLASGVAVDIEIAVRVIATTEYAERQSGGGIVFGGTCLGATDRRCGLGVADCELVVIGCEGVQTFRFDLYKQSELYCG